MSESAKGARGSMRQSSCDVLLIEQFLQGVALQQRCIASQDQHWAAVLCEFRFTHHDGVTRSMLRVLLCENDVRLTAQGMNHGDRCSHEIAFAKRATRSRIRHKAPWRRPKHSVVVDMRDTRAGGCFRNRAHRTLPELERHDLQVETVERN